MSDESKMARQEKHSGMREGLGDGEGLTDGD